MWRHGSINICSVRVLLENNCQSLPFEDASSCELVTTFRRLKWTVRSWPYGTWRSCPGIGQAMKSTCPDFPWLQLLFNAEIFSHFFQPAQDLPLSRYPQSSHEKMVAYQCWREYQQGHGIIVNSEWIKRVVELSLLLKRCINWMLHISLTLQGCKRLVPSSYRKKGFRVLKIRECWQINWHMRRRSRVIDSGDIEPIVTKIQFCLKRSSSVCLWNWTENVLLSLRWVFFTLKDFWSERRVFSASNTLPHGLAIAKLECRCEQGRKLTLTGWLG